MPPAAPQSLPHDGDMLLRVADWAGQHALPGERIDAFVWSALGVAVGPGGRAEVPVVTRVRDRSPAARIGLAPGDAIYAVGGREVANPEEFRRRFAALRNKNSVLLTVGRGRRLYRVTIPLDRRA